MYKITPKQIKVLDAIMSYTKEHKYPPSVRELCEILNLKSPSTVHQYLQKLKMQGLIRWEEGYPRTLTVTKMGLTDEF